MGNENNIKLKSMLRKGTILHGTYRIDNYLSSGGFGNTYFVTHINFNKHYAIKEFFIDGVNERVYDSTTVRVSNKSKVEEFTGQRAKFYKEAQRLNELSNSHIVRVHDLFDENGTTYYVMDYIDGESLKDYLVHTGKPMSEEDVEDVLHQVLEALDEVHRLGLYHMDLKPANIMLDRKGVVKLIDFGASKQFNADKGGALSTSAVAYTNGYAPREQMEKNFDKFGPWTDFYALGATLYNLLSNHKPPLPTDIDDDRTADKHLALPKPANVSDRMWGLVLWMMKTHRMDRPQSVNDIMTYINSRSKVANSVPNESFHYEATETAVDDQTKQAKSSQEKTTAISLSLKKAQESSKPRGEKKVVNIPTNQNLSPAPKPKRNLKTIVVAACIGLVLIVGGYTIFSGNSEPVEEPVNKASEAVVEEYEPIKDNLTLGREFLEKNAMNDNVKVTESGLQYMVLKEGNGAKPGPTDLVTVHYTGTLIDGKVFDSSVERGEPATFPLDKVIPGWTEGLQLMSEGSKYRLFIPSELAYGEKGAGENILPNSTLIFDVELIKVEKQE